MNNQRRTVCQRQSHQFHFVTFAVVADRHSAVFSARSSSHEVSPGCFDGFHAETMLERVRMNDDVLHTVSFSTTLLYYQMHHAAACLVVSTGYLAPFALGSYLRGAGSRYPASPEPSWVPAQVVVGSHQVHDEGVAPKYLGNLGGLGLSVV